MDVILEGDKMGLDGVKEVVAVDKLEEDKDETTVEMYGMTTQDVQLVDAYGKEGIEKVLP